MANQKALPILKIGKAREFVSDDSYILYNEERRMKRNAESGLFEKPF